MSGTFRTIDRGENFFIQEQLHIVRSETASKEEKKEAMERMAERLFPIVRSSVAINYKRNTLDEQDEIVQYTMVFLMDAIRLYNEEKSNSFLSYFVSNFVIKGYEQFTIQKPLIHIPEKKLRAIQQLSKASNRLRKRNGQCSMDDLAEELGWPVRRVKELLVIQYQMESTVSIDVPVPSSNDGKERSLAEYALPDRTSNVESAIIAKETEEIARLAVQEGMHQGHKKERGEAFFLRQKDGYSVREVAQMFGVQEQTINSNTSTIKRLMRSQMGEELYHMLGGQREHCPGYTEKGRRLHIDELPEDAVYVAKHDLYITEDCIVFERDAERGYEMLPESTSHGYRVVRSKNAVAVSVHRLYAEAFIDHSEEDNILRFVTKNTMDVSRKNLRWVRSKKSAPKREKAAKESAEPSAEEKEQE